MSFKQVYLIDKDGFKIGVIVPEFDENNEIIGEYGDNIVISDNPHGFQKAKWLDGKWVEGETLEEKLLREAQEEIDNKKPTQEDIDKANRELEIIILLEDLGVLQ